MDKRAYVCILFMNGKYVGKVKSYPFVKIRSMQIKIRTLNRGLNWTVQYVIGHIEHKFYVEVCVCMYIFMSLIKLQNVGKTKFQLLCKIS